MAELGEQDFEDALEFVRSCETAPDLDAYRSVVLELREHVPGHLISYNEVDLAAPELVSELEPDDLRFPGDWEVFSRYAHQHPVIAYVSDTGDTAPHTISDFLGVEEFHALDIYRRFFRRMGVEDQISFALPSSPELVIGIAISRRERGFSHRDRAFLSLVAPHAGEAYLVSRARADVRGTLDSAEPNGAVTAIVLTDDGRADWLGALAPRLLERWLGAGPGARGELPRVAADYVRRARARTDAPEGLLLQSGALMVERDDRMLLGRLVPRLASGDRDVLLLEERVDPLASARIGALGLTQREAEVVRLLAEGLTNAAIAQRLGVRPSTVKRHLENVYGKFGVRGRTAVVGHLLHG